MYNATSSAPGGNSASSVSRSLGGLYGLSLVWRDLGHVGNIYSLCGTSWSPCWPRLLSLVSLPAAGPSPRGKNGNPPSNTSYITLLCTYKAYIHKLTLSRLHYPGGDVLPPDSHDRLLIEPGLPSWSEAPPHTAPPPRQETTGTLCPSPKGAPPRVPC